MDFKGVVNMNELKIKSDANNVMVTKENDAEQIIIVDKETMKVTKFIWEDSLINTTKALEMAIKAAEIGDSEVD